MIISYMAKYAEFYRVRVPKDEIIARLWQRGYYNLKDLSDEEYELFETKENLLIFISHPLLFMVK